MKRCVALLCLVVLAFCVNARAQSPDDLYVRIHALIYEADGLNESGQGRQALEKYTEAQTSLTRLQRGFPEWAPDVVKFRLGYLESRIAEVRAKLQPAEAVPVQKKPETPAAPPTPEWENQLTGLRQEISRLNEEKKLLEAKLKEALAAQPAAIDPRELERAEQKILELQKNNELFQANLTQLEVKTGAADAAALAKAQDALAAAQTELTAQKELAANLALEKEALQNQVRNLSKPAPDNAALSQAMANLEEANRALEAQKERVGLLEQEKQALQLALRNQQPAPAVNVEALKKELADQQEVIGRLTREKDALQSRVRSPEPQSETIAALRARVAALEAQKTPFTAEELALLTPPKADIPATPAKASARQPLATAAPLLTEAQRHFAAGEFNQAEQKYLRALELDDQNALALANLAVIQIELNRLEEAEKNVRKALAIAPEDAFSYSTLGQVKYRQAEYGPAAEALSRAAQLDPQNAEIQSRLGIVFSQQGLRGPAEAAFRKALQVQPGYGPAHLNLAVLYASQQPPLGELALWHYQRARKAGSPANPDLEKMIETARAAAPK